MQDKFKRVFVPIVVVLVAIFAFGLGRLSKIEDNKSSLIIEQTGDTSIAGLRNEPNNIVPSTESGGEVKGLVTTGKYVASKSGTKYHYPWCPGASQIKEANKIYFNTPDAAIAAGYGPAANCPGL